MLILPIVNRNRVMSVQIKIKNAEKIRTEVRFDDADESEIIVNTEKYSESSFYNNKDKTAPIDFIRSRSLLYPRNYLITTKERDNSKFYDLYEVSQPHRKVNDGLDELMEVLESLGYKKTDIKKILPNVDASLPVEQQVKDALKLLMR